MTIAVLCNNPVAFPALQALQRQGVAVAVGADAANKELCAQLQPFCSSAGFRLRFFDKETFEPQLNQWLDEVTPDAVLMMTCPFRIPASALAKPRQGFLNFHYGLLPQYRGANPVFEQIRRREPVGGITVHRVDEQIDTGGIVLQQKIPLHPEETFGLHMDRLALLGAEVLSALLPLLASANPLPATPQHNDEAHYYKKPVSEDVTIRWATMPAADIVALANACNPWNFGAGTSLSGNTIGINTAAIVNGQPSPAQAAGTILTIDSQAGLTISTCDNKIIRLDILYINGNFIPGYRLALFGVLPGMAFI